MGDPRVQVIGGGPAGSSAALAALQSGASVALWEQSRLPRHKVCGEFLSPGVVPLLGALQVESAFWDARPAPVRRMIVSIGRARKQAPLPETAWGLSRFALDHLLLRAAAARGAQVLRQRGPAPCQLPTVLAAGRQASQPKGRRLFGFKAHYQGPLEDAVELYFFGRCYLGINSVEDGRVNVCGLGPESDLARFHFDIDEMLHAVPELRDRLAPLRRVMDWLTTGPLVFGNRFRASASPSAAVYPAGDQLSFVDPFTGSGMLSAILTGSLAGRAAAARRPQDSYLRQCRTELQRPFQVAGLFRDVIASGWAERLLPCVPAALLFRWTRP